MPNFLGNCKHGTSKACGEVCSKKRGRRSKEDTWKWKVEVKGAITSKKDEHKVMCRNSTEEHKSLKN